MTATSSSVQAAKDAARDGDAINFFSSDWLLPIDLTMVFTQACTVKSLIMATR